MEAKLSEQDRQFLSGGGETGEIIRNFDWTNTPLGPPQDWEQSLKTCVRIMLTSSQPIWIGWGTELIKLYNDPYKAIVGGKHPGALGQPASVVWRDIWKDIEPLLTKAMKNGEGSYVESQLLIMERNDYPEETYYTFSYTPVLGSKGEVAGMICANTDDTARIINERMLETLRDLGKLSYQEKTMQEIYFKASNVLANNNKDFPCAMFWEINEAEKLAKTVAWAGNKNDYSVFPQSVDIQTPLESTTNFCKAINNNEIVLSEILSRWPDAPTGYWAIPPKQFIHIPLTLSNKKLPVAVLTIGLNPFRKYDNSYRQFIQLLADQLVLSLNNMYILEEERKRAEALAEIDKAKTVFFNNISHEFRTPLTLMLGPLEELMNQPEIMSNEQHFSNIATTHRNAVRLLKLVNALLDFSRIESGRQQANFTLVDIAAFTKNLASTFRSVIEKAGLELIVKAEIITEPVYVDKQMWEKIVFNLLSNAFKYTLTGSITVNLFTENNKVILQVIDTGIGIPEKELPHMFERFHRVEGAAGRTYEGTGIGLSMIKELVLLNSGTIEVESKEGKGSTFTVRIPAGKEHLPSDRISHKENELEETISNVFVEEALTLFENGFPKNQNGNLNENKENNTKTASILVVDDNADMREYISTLLEKNYQVITANHGLDALQKINEKQPSLIVSDIMMPVMDGIRLLQEVKNNPKTASIPVILLSARAGEEEKIKGYEIGADDYLIKPFSAKELMARIRSQLKITATRQHTEQQLKNLFLQAPVAICIFRGPQYIVEVANEKMLEFWGKSARQVMNKPLFEGLPDAKGQGFEELLDSVYKTGKRFVAPELPINLFRKDNLEKVFVKFVYEALYDEDGSISGIMALADEIKEQILARQKIEKNEERLNLLIEASELGTWELDLKTDEINYSARYLEIFGYNNKVAIDHQTFVNQLHPDDLPKRNKAFKEALKTGVLNYEIRLIRPDHSIHWIEAKGKVFYDEEKQPHRLIGTISDITDRKNQHQKLMESEHKFRVLANAMPQLVWIADSKGVVNFYNDQLSEFAGATRLPDGNWTWENMIHPEEVKSTWIAWKKAVNQGTAYSSEHRIKLKNGEYRWFLSRAFPQKDNEENIVQWYGTATDIQEQKMFAQELEKQVQERTVELEEHNTFIETLLNSTLDIILVIDNDLKFISVNENARNALAPFGNVIGKYLTDINPEVKQHFTWNNLEKALNGEMVKLSSYKASSNEKYYEMAFVPLKRNNQVYAVMIIMHDITERILQEEKINQLNQTFSLAEQTSKIGSFRVKMSTRTVTYSDNLYRLLGCEPQEFEPGATNFLHFVHPDDLDSVKSDNQSYTQIKNIRVSEFRIIKKTGEIINVRSTGMMINENDGKHFISTIQDVSEQVQTEQLLKENQEKFNKLFQFSPFIITLADAAGKYIDVNESYVKTLGFTREEVMGRTSSELGIIDEEVRERILNELDEKGQVKNIEAEVCKKNGEKIPVLISIETIFIGKQKYYLNAINDIIERKKAEEKIEQKNMELEKMNKELQSFTYISSHDLQEPLRKIQTFSSQIMEKESENLTDDGKDRFLRMQNAAQRMQTLIDDLLAYSRTNTSERKFEKTDLSRIVEIVKEELKEELQQKQATVEANEMCEVKIIPFQFRQLLHNLIGNSLKFSTQNNPPHIKITAEIDKGIKFNNEKLAGEINYCHIKVSDNGIGFEQEYSEKIFEVFQRLHGRNQYEGTGIGLAIVKKIVENHNGIITAKSELNKGATFDIYIPAQ